MSGRIAWRYHLVAIALAMSATLALAQTTKMVTGTATYRERIALPPKAVFEATLEDVSRPDSLAILIGRTRVETPGQPPFRFSIDYEPARIVENRTYSVRARIRVDGKLIFITDQSYPVLTKGHGNHVVMIMRRVGSSAGGGAASKQAEPRVVRRGMFRYMADAAGFTGCDSRQRWPVAMEGAYKALEAAYISTRRQPGEEFLVEIEGQVAERPGMEEGRPPIPTLVIGRYIGIFPGETCGAPSATSPLQETYWKLTRLGDKPVMLAEGQREPSLVFRSQQSRVTGFGGCNNLTGTYILNGDQMTLSGIAATRMACLQGMDIEGALIKALEQVSTWKISVNIWNSTTRPAIGSPGLRRRH